MENHPQSVIFDLFSLVALFETKAGDHFGIIWDQCWDCFGTMLRSFLRDYYKNMKTSIFVRFVFASWHWFSPSLGWGAGGGGPFQEYFKYLWYNFYTIFARFQISYQFANLTFIIHSVFSIYLFITYLLCIYPSDECYTTARGPFWEYLIYIFSIFSIYFYKSVYFFII